MSRRYLELRPDAELAPYVRRYWFVTAGSPLGAPLHSRVLPDGCVDLLFNLGDTLHRGGRGALPATGAAVVGAMRSAGLVTLRGRVDVVGVRFRPGSARALLAEPLDRLTDAAVPLEALWGAAAGELLERLAAAPGPAERVRILDAALAARLRVAAYGRAGGLDPRVDAAVRMIERERGRCRIAHVEREVGLGGRQLERLFHSEVGLGPKRFSRVARFRAALARLGSAPAHGWTDVAYAAGYADQAHLIREFRALAGLTPGAYLRER